MPVKLAHAFMLRNKHRLLAKMHLQSLKERAALVMGWSVSLMGLTVECRRK